MNQAQFQQYMTANNSISNATSPGVFQNRKIVAGQQPNIVRQKPSEIASPLPQQSVSMSAQQRQEGLRISS